MSQTLVDKPLSRVYRFFSGFMFESDGSMSHLHFLNSMSHPHLTNAMRQCDKTRFATPKRIRYSLSSKRHELVS